MTSSSSPPHDTTTPQHSTPHQNHKIQSDDTISHNAASGELIGECVAEVGSNQPVDNPNTMQSSAYPSASPQTLPNFTFVDSPPSVKSDSCTNNSTHVPTTRLLQQPTIRHRHHEGHTTGTAANRQSQRISVSVPDAASTSSQQDEMVPSSAGSSIQLSKRKLSHSTADSSSPCENATMLSPIASDSPSAVVRFSLPHSFRKRAHSSGSEYSSSGSYRSKDSSLDLSPSPENTHVAMQPHATRKPSRRRALPHALSLKNIPPVKQKFPQGRRKRALTIDTAAMRGNINSHAPISNRSRKACFECDGFSINNDGVVKFPDFLVSAIQKNGAYKGMHPKLEQSRSRLEEYESERILGEGRSSRVSLVRDIQTSKPYARKTIFLSHEIPDYMVTRELIAMILCYSSRHVVKFVDAFYDGFCVHIISEYLDGTCLSELTHVDEIVGKAILYQVVMAVASVHKCSIVHMDIKLSNMILKSDGVVVLYDFGLSLLLPPAAKHFDQKYSSDGTIAYMSPEKMQNHAFCFPSDVWSVGIGALRLVSGYLPDTSMDRYYASMDNILAVPGQLNHLLKCCSREFFDFVHSCLQVDPAKRPSAEKLLQHQFFEDMNENMSELILQRWLQEQATH